MSFGQESLRRTFGRDSGSGATRPTIVLAVTVDQSLKLLHGQPQFLASRGWIVHVVSAGDSECPPEEFVGHSKDVTLHRIPMTRALSPLKDLVSFVMWMRLLHNVRPHVICVGTPKASLLSLLAARALAVPNRVYLIRGLRFESARGVARRVLVAVERLTCVLSTRAIAVGPSVLAVVVGEHIAGSQRVSVLGAGSSNGVAIPEPAELGRLRVNRAARKRELGLSGPAPVIGFVGRMTPDKGVLDLARACVRLVGSGVDVQLLMVGAEDSKIGVVPQLEEILTQGNVPHRLTGYLASPLAALSAMDVFCLPSMREGMPNGTLEAAAIGLPVVTTDATGCCDSVLPGISGIIYSAGDCDELVSSLKTLVESATLRSSMGSAGAKWVRESFERDVVWDRYERFFWDLASVEEPASESDIQVWPIWLRKRLTGQLKQLRGNGG